MIHHFITDCRNIGGIVREVSAEVEVRVLEGGQDPREVRGRAGLQAAVVGRHHAGHLQVEGLRAVLLLLKVAFGLDHDLEIK